MFVVRCRICGEEIEGVATRVMSVNIEVTESEVNKGERYSTIKSLPETERYYHRNCLPTTSIGGF